MTNSGEYSDSDIAIIGMALRVPGARNTSEFWSNLRNGVESIRDLSQDELLEAGEKPDRMRKKNYVPRAADMPDMGMFDAEFFGLSPKEAAIMDPQHRQFLECSWEAMETACRTPEHIDGPVGVFAGCGMGSYFYFNVCSHKGLVDETGMFLLRHTGNDKDFLSTRASFAFDLHGPSVNVQTACSTSLVAVHYACQSLFSGECDMALAGGSTIELPHRRGYIYQDGEILSPDGHCRAFDHRAAGTVFGSGSGVVVLRRLADALADGDPIRAVIKSTAINNDGASKAGYLAPSVSGQAAAIVEALAIADIPADSVQYVECHGTGTYLGDPIEIEALTQAFRQTSTNNGFCRVGSVKTNIGHLDTAAGIVSLIKTALALENREIPPSLGFEKPNPAINFADSPFLVNDRLTPWTSTGPRLAGVNSLGVGGTNAHAVLQEAPELDLQPKEKPEIPQILLFSARTNKAVGHAAERIGAYIDHRPDIRLTDISHSLAKGRRQFEHNGVIAVRDTDDAALSLKSGDQTSIFSQSTIEDLAGAVFLFPGGGAQYPGMGGSLYVHEPAFKTSVDEGLSYLPADVAAEIRQLWLDDKAPDAANRLLKPSLQLPAILIIEVAIARLFADWGIKPKAMIGHSMGENTAACIAGVLSFEHAVKLVRLRGELFDEITGGGMLSVALPPEELKRRVPETLDIASVNAPDLCVVSGRDEELETFRKALLAEDIEANRVPINIAAHSRLLDPILSRFEAFLRSISLRAPEIPIISNLTGNFLTGEQAADPHYWTTHLRSTVRFSDCVKTVAETGRHFYIEAGPGRALSSLAKAQDAITANQVANSLPHPDEKTDDQLHLLGTIGRCRAAGLDVDLDRQWRDSAPQRIPLPTYPFQHQHYFLDIVENRRTDQDSEALAKITQISDWGWKPIWRQSLPDTKYGADAQLSSWLIFLDDTGAGEKIAARLRDGGHKVITVAPSDVFAKLGDNAYTLCDEDGRPGYDALFQELTANGGIPEGILHMGLFTGAHRHRPGSSFFHRNQERGFFSLFYLAQALAEADAAHDIQITVVTNGMQRVGEEAVPYPEKATILGPVQVIPKEMPSISVRGIDLPASDEAQPARSNGFLSTEAVRDVATAPELIDQLWDDLFAENDSEIIAYRNGRRWKQAHEAHKLDAPKKGADRFRENGVYLLTGGLGDLGSVFALDLARRYKARLVLLGRTELPGRDNWDDYVTTYGDTDRIGKAITTIKAIEDAGGEVLYASADVTDAEAMTALVADAKARFGAVHGLLHMAGIVKDELIQLKEPGDINDVFAPKVMGSVILAEALADQPLDLIVLFSSTSTDIAPAGQVDYVAANAFLNAFAESRAQGEAPHVVAIHWGVWKETGLAARSVQTVEQDNDAPASITTIDNYLFDRNIRDAEGREAFEGRWDAKRHWIRNEHRLANGEAVWPGTGYIEAISQALAASGINGAYEIADLTFLRPLPIPDGGSRIARVTLERLGGARQKVTIETKSASEEVSGWIKHAEASVRPHWGARREAVDPAGIASACSGKIVEAEGEALRSAQEAHLDFGPRWKVLRSLHLGKAEAMARLELAEAFTGDLDGQTRLHPALLDIATGYAMELVPGYDPAAKLWVPMSYGCIRILHSLPQRIWSHVRLNSEDAFGDGYAVFDITIYDENGQVLVEIEKFTVKQLLQTADFAASAQDHANDAAQKPVPQSASGQQELSPALARLARQVDNGIAPNEGVEALMRAIGSGLPQIIVSSMDLPALQRTATQSDEETDTAVAFERPTLDNDFVAPRNELEETLAGYWSELLGVQTIGVHDNFFDLGGHSLIAVRLFRMIRKAFAVDFPISVLFEAPTIAQCAELIEARGGAAVGGGAKADNENSPAAPEQTFVHLVQMSTGKNPNETPFFVCAGMFGNILNLRHLAIQIGQDRPVYGLQARGLYGDQAPHETFEDMARDYLKEIRTIQPEGPYLLSGFSGGGLVAYEMAQQLTAAGEMIAMLSLLDTPYPEDVSLSMLDRISIRTQDIRREGTAFFVRYVKWRIEWERQRLRERNSEPASAEQFHSKDVQEAFMHALSRYEAAPYDGQVLLLRPKLRIAYRLSDGRELNADRGAIHADNGWSPFIRNLAIVEVPGDHDGMVLEPNVRVLAGHLRKALNQSEWGLYPSVAAE
ncbi:MAG: SDR family NAD(P)-dependent oxidoreductase [Hyphomicrobiales bacterium]|nr:SDR family NAD(P)-dependent oxidoreductase [Hyphomicrobiales bacterium]